MAEPVLSPLDRKNMVIISVLARQVDDLEATREAIDNRVFQLTNSKPDKDGQLRGLGLSETDPDVRRLLDQADAISAVEKNAVTQLERCFRESVWKPWQSAATGVGEKQLARLLGTLGDPAWNTRDGRFRTVDELYVYSGYSSVSVSGHTPASTHSSITADGPKIAPKHHKGHRSNWSPEVRMRTWLIAQKCMMQRSGTTYRDVYEAGRIKYAEAVHVAPCAQCAGKGNPPHETGSPLRPGHQMARALRLVSKQILKDLWRESRRLHGFGPDEVVRRAG